MWMMMMRVFYVIWRFVMLQKTLTISNNEFISVIFKYTFCFSLFMTAKIKKEYKWKTVKAFLKDLEKAKQDPSFMKALHAFIKYHSH